MARISVIMNCLNGAQYLPQALDSLSRQTFKDFEIIFWDNCSVDESPAIAQSFDSRLKYYSSNQRMPLGAARNHAIAKATAPYIAFLDCDDLWQPQKLEKQLNLIETNPNLGLICTDTVVFTDKRDLYKIFEQSPPARGQAFEELMNRQWISMSSAFITSRALNTVQTGDGKWFDEKLNVCEEADLFYRIAHDFELDYVPEALTRWRVHGQNTTFRKFGQFAEETRQILAKHRILYPGYDTRYPALVQTLNRRIAFQQAVSLWQQGANKAARQAISPYLSGSSKHQLFWLASFLPSSFFNLCARIYFGLPAALRR